jgi:hypothetical protein
LTNSIGAKLEPGYLASTGAVRPALVEKRNWATAFSQNKDLGEAGNRYEQLMASAYDLASCNAAKPQSIFEYRQSTEFGENLGWRNFGDLAWGDGYSNLHYDLPFLLLREYVRTGDTRAFQLGSELARYRADWGHYHADDYWDNSGDWNLKGMAFYEKGRPRHLPRTQTQPHLDRRNVALLGNDGRRGCARIGACRAVKPFSG